MTQQYLGQIPDPAQESGIDLAARLNGFDNGHRSNQSGPTRPAGILAGGVWTRVTAGVYEVMMFDGAQDHVLMRGTSNLAGLTNLELARLNLGLKGLAIKDKVAIDTETTGTLPLNRGGTGGTTQAAARSGIGITVGSGGLNRLNESVNHVDASWAAGVSDLPGLASPKQIADAIAAMALGVGQTWVNVTSSRVRNTTYQNTTGRAILVAGAFRAWVAVFQVSTDGTSWTTITSGNDGGTTTILVPPGQYYRLNQTTSDAIWIWAELR